MGFWVGQTESGQPLYKSMFQSSRQSCFCRLIWREGSLTFLSPCIKTIKYCIINTLYIIYYIYVYCIEPTFRFKRKWSIMRSWLLVREDFTQLFHGNCMRLIITSTFEFLQSCLTEESDKHQTMCRTAYCFPILLRGYPTNGDVFTGEQFQRTWRTSTWSSWDFHGRAEELAATEPTQLAGSGFGTQAVQSWDEAEVPDWENNDTNKNLKFSLNFPKLLRSPSLDLLSSGALMGWTR